MLDNNIFKRTKFYILIISASILALSLFSCTNSNSKSKDQNTVSIRLKWLHQSQFAGFYVAQQKEFYKSQGVNVILNPGGMDYPSIPLVLNGADDFGIAGADQIIQARAQGQPVVAIAVIYKRTPFCLFSWKDNGINEINDIKNKIVGVKYGGNEEFTYRAMLSKAVEINKLSDYIQDGKVYKLKNEIPVKYDLTPFLNNQVNVWPGYSINEPLLAKEKTSKDVKIIMPSDYGLNIYADVLFTSENMIKNNKVLVDKVVKASMMGWRYSLDPKNADETVNTVLRYAMWSNYNHEMSMLKSSMDLVSPKDDDVIGKMKKENWESLQKIMLDFGFINKAIDIEKVFTNEFIN
jgi:NitT/TauT family transport system substrate-binding protein